MTKEEDFFKENFPEYVTEKGEFLTPYWDLFRAGVICANFESKVKIEQLEKENAELKTIKIPQLERRIASIRGCHSVDVKKLNARIEQVERLKKENTEVREELTEAKDIIRNLLRVTYGEGWNYSLDWKVKAEQFLKELEK